MNDTALASSRQLATLLRREHGCLADFLVALAAFDREGPYRSLGYASLFDYLHRELRLSRAAAHFRKVAARLVGRFPEVVEPLRDGRLCITSVVALAKVITDANRAEVVPQFFHCSKQEAREVAAAIAPVASVPRKPVVTALPAPSSATAGRVRPGELTTNPVEVAPRTTVDPLTSDLRRLHLTVSAGLLDKLRRAKAGQSHVQPGATDEQVIDAALDLLLAQQEKRRAAVPPKVKREVKMRDGNRCQWPTHDGGICGSIIRLEIDHVVPRGRGGPSTAENCRVLCDVRNQEAARQAYGDAHMDLFAPLAREPVAPWLGAPGARYRARSNTSTSATPSPAPSTSSAASSTAARPSPARRRWPFTVTSPRATCTQATRPSGITCRTRSPRERSAPSMAASWWMVSDPSRPSREASTRRRPFRSASAKARCS